MRLNPPGAMIDENPYAAPDATVDSEYPVRGKSFKFKYINEHGYEAGFRARRGVLGEETLTLDGQDLPMASIGEVVARGNRVVLSAFDGAGRQFVVMFAVRSGPKSGVVMAQGIKREIDRTSSAFWATARREALRHEGKEGLFRSRPCDHCAATIDLTGFPKTPQAYCRYCDSVSSPAGQGPADEGRFHRCDNCGYVGVPALFDTAVLVILGAFIYYSSQRRYVCHFCMKRIGWINLLKNLPTIIGAPFAAYPLAKAYSGGSARSAAFGGLEKANGHASKGRIERAEALYGELLARQRYAAIVHYNRALARAGVKDWKGCLDALNDAWADCANYDPGLPLAQEALASLGRHEEIPALLARWNGEVTSV